MAGMGEDDSNPFEYRSPRQSDLDEDNESLPPSPIVLDLQGPLEAHSRSDLLLAHTQWQAPGITYQSPPAPAVQSHAPYITLPYEAANIASDPQDICMAPATPSDLGGDFSAWDMGGDFSASDQGGDFSALDPGFQPYFQMDASSASFRSPQRSVFSSDSSVVSPLSTQLMHSATLEDSRFPEPPTNLPPPVSPQHSVTSNWSPSQSSSGFPSDYEISQIQVSGISSKGPMRYGKRSYKSSSATSWGGPFERGKLEPEGEKPNDFYPQPLPSMAGNTDYFKLGDTGKGVAELQSIIEKRTDKRLKKTTSSGLSETEAFVDIPQNRRGGMREGIPGGKRRKAAPVGSGFLNPIGVSKERSAGMRRRLSEKRFKVVSPTKENYSIIPEPWSDPKFDSTKGVKQSSNLQDSTSQNNRPPNISAERTFKIRTIYLLLQLLAWREGARRIGRESSISSSIIEADQGVDAGDRGSPRTRSSGTDKRLSSQVGSSNGQSKGSSGQNKSSGSGKRKATGNDGDDNDKNEQPPHKRTKKGSIRSLNGQLACPFAKADPTTHINCILIGRKDLSGVKEHLRRNHFNEVTPMELLLAKTWDAVFDFCNPSWSPRPRPTPYVDMLELFLNFLKWNTPATSSTETGMTTPNAGTFDNYIRIVDNGSADPSLQTSESNLSNNETDIRDDLQDQRSGSTPRNGQLQFPSETQFTVSIPASVPRPLSPTRMLAEDGPIPCASCISNNLSTITHNLNFEKPQNCTCKLNVGISPILGSKIAALASPHLSFPLADSLQDEFLQSSSFFDGEFGLDPSWQPEQLYVAAIGNMDPNGSVFRSSNRLYHANKYIPAASMQPVRSLGYSNSLLYPTILYGCPTLTPIEYYIVLPTWWI
ncbi:hypothetical protein H072_703 [Dactylellina haptotyla CBS 200.50]|uniref:Uncharacterized protein n=1 Tax=Dactylellina haptotyla (strain CBS 200.50) TaxID=1284197 RepID=S8AWI6_DACHA|nr:hypothetical protein H072_703 [Dactylellina haptotyla CBS 200.50]